MSAADLETVAAMLDLLVYENILVAWQLLPSGGYDIVLHDGETIVMAAPQAELWTIGAFSVFLALVNQGRIRPRFPGI